MNTNINHEYIKLKRIYDHGILISKANKNIGFNIKLYAIKRMFDEIKKNPDKQKESEIKTMLISLNKEKRTPGVEEFSKFEYEEFLENFFANIDDEDRYGEVDIKTAQSFRICADLIEVFKNWDEIDFEWIKKYANINSILTQGFEIEEDENDFTLNLSKKIENDLPNKNKEKSKISYENDIDNFNINDVSSIAFQEEKNSLRCNNSTPLPKGFSSKLENKSKDSENINPNKPFYNPNEYDKEISINKEKLKNSKEDAYILQNIADKKIIENPKLHKKLDFDLPVIFKSQNYYRLQAIITKLMSNAKIDIETNCEDKAKENLEIVRYYLSKIDR